MIKILYCEHNIDGTIGGSYYSLFYLVTNLDRDKYHPIVVFYRDNEFVHRLKNANIEAIVLKKYKPLNLSFGFNNTVGCRIIETICLKPIQKAVNLSRGLILSAFEKVFFLRQNKIELVHLNNSINHNHDWMLAARILGIKCITHERGINEGFPLTAQYFGKKLQAVICISKAVQDNLYQQTNLKNLVLIYNGLDPSNMRVTKTPEEIRKEYGIDFNAPVVGIVGNIKAWKGQDVVVRALSLVKKQFYGVKCFIVGDTSANDNAYREEVNKLVNEFHLENTIIFTGFQRNVSNFTNTMDIVIHASLLPEPFGRVILEPMALKKPVIATNFGAAPEIIEDGVTGLLVPPGNPGALAEGIIELFKSKFKRKQMGQAGYDRLMSNFSLASNIHRTTELYENLIKKL